MKFTFNHFNFNVLDLERSLAFYEKALGLKEAHRKESENFTLVYLGDGVTSFELELTYLFDRKEPYGLGEAEFHLVIYARSGCDKVKVEFPFKAFFDDFHMQKPQKPATIPESERCRNFGLEHQTRVV